ncbi:putative uncharacterized protein DDB_G0282499 isoform X1 [Halyomorpha halys]|uniref:putative uncharacterized protein DDB_G0282499 isoform X1 n=1 Tax=Halyomorpha halys TaxID=286706 RepID=UPI0006D4CE41|nr:putative uncharacterized protein DDB_G0287457 isoform X1 [Halyomorpha halys]
MESNIRPNTEENRKRAASGRLSPRSLFGNLKVKRSFQEEDMVSRNLNNSKSSHAWKPPIKVDSNETINTIPCCNSDIETSSHSFRNHESNLSQNRNFILNESHCSHSTENLYQTVNGTDYHVNSNKIFPDNSKEATEDNKEFIDENNLMNNQDIDYSEENICCDLENYTHNSVVKQDLDGIQRDYRPDPEDRNSFQSLTKKLDFTDNNHEYIKRSFQESDNIQLQNPSRNKINFENQNYEENDTLSQDTVKLERDSRRNYMDTEMHYKDEDQEYSEKSDSSKSTIELSRSEKFPKGLDDKNNILLPEINHENRDKETREFYVTRGVDDSFDTGVTNSQFLQLENQISKNSSGINIKNFYNDPRPFLNNLETMKRYCTSLTAQTEWQKNVLKSITRDVDDLNKAIVNVTEALRSLQKDNASAK